MKTQAAAPKKAPEIPKGYWQDAEGKLVHDSLVRPIDRQRDALVNAIVAEAKVHSGALGAFKLRTMGDIAKFIEQSVAEYDVKVGGKKGNVTLYTFDGRFKVLRAVQDRVEFDERLLAAKQLIEECMADWSRNARYELKALINRAFDVDGDGKINVGRVLALRRVDIKDERWQRAMTALSEALQVVSSKSYIRVYERDDAGEYQSIPLDVAGA
jgi:hypothetical protein